MCGLCGILAGTLCTKLDRLFVTSWVSFPGSLPHSSPRPRIWQTRPRPSLFFFSLFLSAGYRPPTSRVPFRRSNPLGNVSRLFSSLGWHPSPRTRLRPCSMRAGGSRAGWLAAWALGLRERPDAGHAFHGFSPWAALGFFSSASQPPSHP